MTIGAIVIPLAALALCGGGMWLAWRLVRRAEGTAVEIEPPPLAAPLPPGAGSARVVGQLMAVAGAGLGIMGIALALWRAFGWPPLWLGLVLFAVGGAMGILAWRMLRRTRSGGVLTP